MEIAEVIERGRKDNISPLTNVPKVGKVLSKFKAHSITTANEFF